MLTGLVVNQESLWRHGVVHDPAKKKLKVKCPWQLFPCFLNRKCDFPPLSLYSVVFVFVVVVVVV